jgi:hypothetical protein
MMLEREKGKVKKALRGALAPQPTADSQEPEESWGKDGRKVEGGEWCLSPRL